MNVHISECSSDNERLVNNVWCKLQKPGAPKRPFLIIQITDRQNVEKMTENVYFISPLLKAPPQELRDSKHKLCRLG
jgi:hypothetical protein